MSQQINLFNPIFMKQRKMFTLLTMVQALGLIVMGTLLFYGYALYQVEQLREQSKDSDARYAAEQDRFVRFASEFSPQQANQILQDEAQRLEKRAAEQAELVDTLKSGAVGNTTGYSAYMNAFGRQSLPGLWLTGFHLVGDGAQISLTGGVVDPELLPAYIRRMSSEPVMQGKTFADMKMRQPKTDAKDKTAVARYVEFELHSQHAGGAKP
ncbi:MAG: fimbrial assembly protein [Gallionella sp.]|nr:fimbrial assembly protein [Gallionella sp.]